MRHSYALLLALSLVSATFATAQYAHAHDFYHDEFWDEDGCCDHWHGPYVSPSKLDMAWELFETGRHLANCHDLDEAVKPIKQAIELEPRVARFHLTLGMIQRDQGKKDDAIAELRLARKYGYGWVEEEAYWTLKDLGVDPRYEGSAPGAGGSAAAANALYTRLGGHDAIVAVVDNFVGRVAKDERINKFFGKTDIPKFKEHLVEQIASATGGPEVYHGKDMRTVHEGMKITDADFTALVNDLTDALVELRVPQPLVDELLAILGPLKKDIVEVPGSGS